MKPDPTLIARLLSEIDATASIEDVPVDGLTARIAPEHARAALRTLKESDRSYHFLVDLFGIDTGEAIDVVYHVRSFVCDDEVHLRVTLPYGADLASVWDIYPAALMPERECAEMFGLTLSGHPNPKRLLSTEAVPPLLLKSTEIRTAEEVRNR